jgi:hypothetical protein
MTNAVRAARKKQEQRQRKRSGQAVLQVPIVDLVALVDQLTLDGHLDEEDSDSWTAICEATGGLIYRYYRQRETIVPRDPAACVCGPRYGASYINHRTGLLQRQEPPNDDEPWELIKKAVKQETEAESEEYLVVLSDEAAEIAESNSSSLSEAAEPEDRLDERLDDRDDFTDDCEPDAEDLPDEFD